MSMLQSMSAWLPAIDSRSIGEIEQEIQDELEFHLEMRTHDNIRLGMTAAEAQAAALTQFGEVESIRRACRIALVGERIMLQRLQLAIIAILLLAFVVLAYQMYSTKRAMAEVLEQLTQLKSAAAWEADRPRVVNTSPADGATDIDPATNEIRVIFDKEMTGESWSWVRSAAEAFPEAAGDIHYLPDMKTCVMPVKLEPGTKYVVWFNTANYLNFKDREGRPATPHLLTFTTRK